MADTSAPVAVGFVPPPYPYDRLDTLNPIASALPGGLVDLSIGTPCDPPPQAVLDALANSGTERSYPASIGSPRCARPPGVGCNGVSGSTSQRRTSAPRSAPRSSSRRCRSGCTCARRPATRCSIRRSPTPATRWGRSSPAVVPWRSPSLPDGRLDLDSISADDIDRALLLWVNSPSNPTGALDDLDAAADWGRAHGVPVFSDECYVEFTWTGRPRTILEGGSDGRGGGSFAVEAFESRRTARRLLRR